MTPKLWSTHEKEFVDYSHLGVSHCFKGANYLF